VFPSLVAKRMEALEPEVEDLARAAVDDLVAAHGGDFMHLVGNAVPIAVISRLIGFREHDPATLTAAAADSTRIVGATLPLEELQNVFMRSLEIAGWITEEIETGGAADDVLLGTISRGIADGDLSLVQGIAILQTLLSAGGESTSSLLGNAVGILADDARLQDRLRDDPNLLPIFIEEVLRLESPFRQQMRSVAADTSLQGVEIPSGSTVLVFFGAANRDPAEYEDADQLRFDREQPKFHVAFGRGIHFCVGAPLARIEARVVLTTLLASTRSIRRAPGQPAKRTSSLLTWRYEQLPIVAD
jgi:cytochrome P450